MSREGKPPNGDGLQNENIISFGSAKVQRAIDSLLRLTTSQETPWDSIGMEELAEPVRYMQEELRRIVREDKNPPTIEAVLIFVDILTKIFPLIIPLMLRRVREETEIVFRKEYAHTFDLRASILRAHPFFDEQTSQAKNVNIGLALRNVALKVKEWAESQLSEIAHKGNISSELQTVFLEWMISLCVELRLLLDTPVPKQHSLEFLTTFEELFQRLGETQQEILHIEDLKNLLSQWEVVWENRLEAEALQVEISGDNDPVRDARAAYHLAFLLYNLLNRFFSFLQENEKIPLPLVCLDNPSRSMYVAASDEGANTFNECIRTFLSQLTNAVQTEIQDKQEIFALISENEQKKSLLFLAGAMALVQIWLMLLILTLQEHKGELASDKTRGDADDGIGLTPKLQREILRDVLRIGAARNPAFDDYLYLVDARSIIPYYYPHIEPNINETNINAEVSSLIVSYLENISSPKAQSYKFPDPLGDNIIELSAYRTAKRFKRPDELSYHAILFGRICLVSTLVEVALSAMDLSQQTKPHTATAFKFSIAVLKELESAIRRLIDEDHIARFIPKE